MVKRTDSRRMRSPRWKETLTMACGVRLLFIGIAGTMPYMLDIGGKGIADGGTLPMAGCLALGGLTGEVLDIEHRIEMFGVSLI